ncbi:hypothetical protein ACOMHN_047927 [Nucella lapillus]
MAVTLLPAILTLVVLMIVGSVGTIFTMYIFGRKLQPSTQNYLFAWLGFFDFMNCVLGIPSEIMDLTLFYLNEYVILCKIQKSVSGFNTSAAVGILIVIAIDRYRRVCRPLESQLDNLNVKIGVLLSAVSATGIAASTFVMYGKRSIPTPIEGLEGCQCSVQDKYKGDIFELLYQGMLVTIFFVVVIFLFVVYVQVWLEIRKGIE